MTHDYTDAEYVAWERAVRWLREGVYLAELKMREANDETSGTDRHSQNALDRAIRLAAHSGE